MLAQEAGSLISGAIEPLPCPSKQYVSPTPLSSGIKQSGIKGFHSQSESVALMEQAFFYLSQA